MLRPLSFIDEKSDIGCQFIKHLSFMLETDLGGQNGVSGGQEVVSGILPSYGPLEHPQLSGQGGDGDGVGTV